MLRGTWSVLVGVLVLVAAGQSEAARRYVDAGAGGSNNGTSWGNAYTDLQAALADGAATEIWVAGGVYTPGASRFATFQLRSGVAIHGGFAGGEGALDERTGAATTVLSGDIGAPGNAADNCYHVVTGTGVGATAVLEAVTVSGGNAGLSALKRNGGGLIVEGAGSAPQILNCRFIDNFAYDLGGAVYNYEGTPRFVNCLFRDNTAGSDGGGLFTDRGMAEIVNCTFTQNAAGAAGGGVFTHAYAGNSCPNNANFLNCIFFGNTDGDGAGQSAQISAESTVCPPERAAPNAFVVSHCCIGGWDGVFGGPSNLGGDPGFIDAEGRLSPLSPCVDAGTNAALPADAYDLDHDGDFSEPIAVDRDFQPRIIHGVVDIGAYEAQFDCNANGVLDDVDIAGGTSSDCNHNGFPDECDVAVLDCNANGTPDDCEIAAGSVTDCNTNAVPDLCDIAAGSASDCNTNGFPDVCELRFHFFMLDNAAIGESSQVQAFDLATGAGSAPVIAELPPEDNDRGMTVLPGAGRLLVTDIANARLVDIDVFFGTINAILPLDRPLLEIAYDWQSDRLYGTSETGGLYQVDRTNGSTAFIMLLPGGSPEDWVCLTYDPLTRRLLGASQSEQVLYLLDPDTASGQMFPQAFGGNLADLAVDPASGAIYGVSHTGTFHEVDRVTGFAGAPLFTVANLTNTAAGLAIAFASECDGNGVLDACDIAAGTAADCNGNTVPDSCEPDCNANGVADECDAIGGGDFDGDGDVDAADAAALTDCLAGPNLPPAPMAASCSPSCLAAFDLDGDNDIDLADFGIFVRLFTG